jgi:hypothetical protein
MQSGYPLMPLLGRRTFPRGLRKGCLAKNRGSAPAQQRLWREGNYEHIREMMPLQGRLSIEHLCHLVVMRRRAFYRSLRPREPAEEEMEVRSLRDLLKTLTLGLSIT